jgi:hypothetical protein
MVDEWLLRFHGEEIAAPQLPSSGGRPEVGCPGTLDDLQDRLFLTSDGKENAQPVLVAEPLTDRGDGFDNQVQGKAPSYIQTYK